MPTLDVFNDHILENDTDNATFQDKARGVERFQRALHGGHFSYTVKTTPYAATATTMWLQIDNLTYLALNGSVNIKPFNVLYWDGTDYFLWENISSQDPGDGSVSIQLNDSPDSQSQNIGVGNFDLSSSPDLSKFQITLSDAIATPAANDKIAWITNAATGDGVTDDSGAIGAADVSAGTDGDCYGESGDDYRIASPLTLVAQWQMDNGCRFTVDNTTLTLERVPVAGLTQIFNVVNGGGVVLPSGTQAPAEWFGAVADGVADDSAAFSEAAASGAQPQATKGTYRISTNLTLNVDVSVLSNAVFSVDAGVTLTINGGVNATRAQIVSGSGTLAIGKPQTVLPEWWGAVADDATVDSAPAINAAITASAQVSGGVARDTGCSIFFGEGAYYIDSGLSITTNGHYIRFYGTHQRSSKIVANTAMATMLTCGDSGNAVNSRANIDRLHFVANELADCAIDLTVMSNTIVEHCHISNMTDGGYGIKVSHHSNTIQNTEIRGGGFGGTGILVTTDISVNNVRIRDNGLANLKIGVRVNAGVNHLLIQGNTFDTCSETGIYYALGTRNVVQRGNYYEACGADQVYVRESSVDSNQGALAYASATQLTDAGQDFSTYKAASPATHVIEIINTDDSVTWAYIGTGGANTECNLFSDSDSTVAGVNGAPVASRTPSLYRVIVVADWKAYRGAVIAATASNAQSAHRNLLIEKEMFAQNSAPTPITIAAWSNGEIRDNSTLEADTHEALVRLRWLGVAGGSSPALVGRPIVKHFDVQSTAMTNGIVDTLELSNDDADYARMIIDPVRDPRFQSAITDAIPYFPNWTVNGSLKVGKNGGYEGTQSKIIQLEGSGTLRHTITVDTGSFSSWKGQYFRVHYLFKGNAEVGNGAIFNVLIDGVTTILASVPVVSTTWAQSRQSIFRIPSTATTVRFEIDPITSTVPCYITKFAILPAAQPNHHALVDLRNFKGTAKPTFGFWEKGDLFDNSDPDQLEPGCWRNARRGGAYAEWAASTAYSLGAIVVGKDRDQAKYFVCEVAGTSDATEPAWDTTAGNQTAESGAVRWRTSGQTPTTHATSTAYSLGDVVTVANMPNFWFICIAAGTSGGTAPTWTQTVEGTTVDGTVTWATTLGNSNGQPALFLPDGVISPDLIGLERIGSFTTTGGAATEAISVGTNSIATDNTVILIATNATAATLEAGAAKLYVSSIALNSTFTIATADGTNIPAGATYDYIIKRRAFP